MSTCNLLDLESLGLSLRNNRLKLETLGELPTILEESIEEYTSSEWKQNQEMSTYNQLDLESLGLSSRNNRLKLETFGELPII